MIPLVQMRDAAFGYGDGAIVEGIDLDINAGNVIALLGPNGSGKSTLVKGLLGLNDTVRGSVEVFGMPRGARVNKGRIGYVPQRHSLSASVRATAREVVAVGRLARRPWWRPSSASTPARVQECLDQVGLGDAAGTEVSALSGGQQRRVLIARALASEPDVLVMDEPTAGVDAASQDVLAEVLERLAVRGTTMLIVTHELAALELIVNRIVCMRDGRIDFDGSPSEYAAHELAHEIGDIHHHVEVTRPGTHGHGPLETAIGEE